MTQLGKCPTFQSLQYTVIYNTVLAERPGSQRTLELHCSSGGMADELIGLYVVNGERKSGTAALFRLRDGHCIPPQQCLSSSQHIHMVGLYSNMRPLTCRAPVGIQFRCNHDGWIPPTHMPHHPLQAFIIIVTLGARFGPVGPQTFPRRMSQGRTQLQLVHFAVMYACMNTVIFLHAF